MSSSENLSRMKLLPFPINPVTEMATCFFTLSITCSPTPHEFTSNVLSVGWGDGGGLLPWWGEKRPRSISPVRLFIVVFIGLYWKEKKKIGRENCSLVGTICCYGTNGWQVTGFKMEGCFYLVIEPISKQPTFLFRRNVVYTSTLMCMQVCW